MKGYFFISPIEGLNYETLTHSGLTDSAGGFEYEPDETVTFSIGGLILGSAPCESALTPADLSIEVAGNVKKITNRKVTNIARLLLSLNPNDDIEKKITITEEIRAICTKYRKKIYLNQPEDFFTKDKIVQELISELNSTLVSPAFARNYLRRAMYGIIKETDVEIPMRDGGIVKADIFRPKKEGRYPVIISFGGYGKAFWVGKETTPDEIELHAKLEDDYFEGIQHETDYLSFHIASLIAGDPVPQVPGLPPSGSVMNPYLTHISETFERANVLDWVPEGYVVIHADSRGLGTTPGEYCQFGRPEADDYYDAIEWAGVQNWSNGNVGTYGGSFYAMNAFNVASLNPPHLKAFIPLCGDMDPMRDYCRFGGLMNKFGFTPKICKGDFVGEDLAEFCVKNEFDNPDLFNKDSHIAMKGDPADIKVPFFTAISLEQAFIHTRGTSEIYINSSTPSDQKFMDITSEVGVHYWMYGKNIFKRHKAFFDYWLKGEENKLENTDPIHMMVRTGYGSYYWQDEKEWPIARTEYKKLYLQAGNDLKAAGNLSEVPSANGKIEYPGDEENRITFITAPFEEDIVLGGYPMAKLYVSSSSDDMAVLTYIDILDEDNDPVPVILDLNPMTPVSKGGLKISHRKLDENKCTQYRPYHTHLASDVQKLKPGEIAEIQVEMLPMTIRIKKGWKLAFTIMAQNSMGELVDPQDNYSKGATYSLYTGKDYPSFVQIPII